ncbi:hypothetical protein Tco_1199775 [Tanacetum coccineum]
MIINNSKTKKDEIVSYEKQDDDFKKKLAQNSEAKMDGVYTMAVRDFKKFFRRRGRFVRQAHNDKKPFKKYPDDRKGKIKRKCFRCGDENHLIEEFPKPLRHKDQKAFVGGSRTDSDEDNEGNTNNKKCLMAQSSNEVHSNSFFYSDDNSLMRLL